MRSIVFYCLLFLTSFQLNAQVSLPGMPDADGPVNTIIREGNIVFVGGKFNNFGGVYRQNLAAFDANTGVVLNWTPNPNDEVNILLVAKGRLFVGGRFSIINGFQKSNLAGYELSNLNFIFNIPIPDLEVYDLKYYNGKIYYPQCFPSLFTSHIMRFDPLSLQIDNWQTIDLNLGITHSFDINGNYIYIAGYGNIIITPTYYGKMVRCNMLTGLPDTSITYTFNSYGYPYNVVAHSGKIYVAGSFYSINGFSRSGGFELDANGNVSSLNFYCSNDQNYALFPQGNTMWVGGNSISIGAGNSPRIAQVKLSSGYATCWATYASASSAYIKSIFVQGDTVYAGSRYISPPSKFLAIYTGNPSYVTLGPNITFLPGSTYTLTTDKPFQNYLWSTGETTASISVSTAGTYWVSVSSGSCTATDTLEIESAPVVSNLSPRYGNPGDTITISGSGFNTIPENNIVSFGPVQAKIINANSGTLIVTVPNSAAYQSVTVTNKTTGLIGASSMPFTPTFLCDGDIDNNAFETGVNFSSGIDPRSIAIADLNRDGKSEIITANLASNSFSILRNNGINGAISFIPHATFPTGNGPNHVKVADLNGDGKLDIVLSHEADNNISVYKNIGNGAAIGFDSRIIIPIGFVPSAMVLADWDGDGRVDIAITNSVSNYITIFRNTSLPPAISFAPGINISVGNNPVSVFSSDLDSDGKPDLSVVNSGSNSVSVLKNISIAGIISFDPQIILTTGSNPADIAIGDLDGDLMLDIAVSNLNSANISVMRNTSTSFGISFSAKQDFPAGMNPTSIVIGDLDGDASLEIAVLNQGSSMITLLNNNSVPGAISISGNYNFPIGANAAFMTIGDLNDSKPELIFANSNSNSIIILKNKVVGGLPDAPGAINGLATICKGQAGVIYTTPPIANSTGYIWTLPNGATGNSSTNSITVNFDSNVTPGIISVKGFNDCGEGINSILNFDVVSGPPVLGQVTGPSNVCRGELGLIYSLPYDSTITNYNWTLPFWASGNSTTNTISIDIGLTALSGFIFVNSTNICGVSLNRYFLITVNQLPISPGFISGPNTACSGLNGVLYSVSPAPGFVSYSWTLPQGAVGTSNTNSILVNYDSSFVSGTINVFGISSCGNSAPSSLAITQSTVPQMPGVISGSVLVCPGQSSVVYTIAPIPDATSYEWTLPPGATGISTSNSITVNFAANATAGNISVKGVNQCYHGQESILPISMNSIPALPGSVTGITSVCQGQNNVIFSIPPIPNTTSYTWILPTGFIGASLTNTISVNIGSSAMSGNIFVNGNNICGAGPSTSKLVNIVSSPAAPGFINGFLSVCQGRNLVKYSVVPNPNVTSYEWTLPAGMSGSSNSDSILIDFATTATAGTIYVKGINPCGVGTTSSKYITVNPLPGAANAITGLVSVCEGQLGVMYYTQYITNASRYLWALPPGASGASLSSSISVNYDPGSLSGNISVRGNNTCGSGPLAFININVDPMPAAPVITLVGNELQSNIPTGNQWYNQSGIISGATAQNYTVTSGGNYYSIITDMGCPSLPSNTIFVSFTGVENHNESLQINIYPVPLINELTIEIIGGNGVVNYELLNPVGQPVRTGNIENKKTILIDDLASGLYLLKLESENSVVYRKIIKK